MKKLIVLILLTCSQAHAWEQTDWQCMQDCQARGYQYGYCHKICSFDPQR